MSLTPSFFEKKKRIIKLGGLNDISNLSILDCGCGTRAWGKLFSNSNKVIGVDISLQMVKKANQVTNSNYEAIVGDLEDKNLFDQDSFDVIFCGLILHHFPDISRVVSNFNFWLKPAGRIVIVETNGSNPVKAISRFCANIYKKLAFKSFIRAEIASVNETDHSYGYYLKQFKFYDLAPSVVEVIQDPVPLPKIQSFFTFLCSIKRLLYRLS